LESALKQEEEEIDLQDDGQDGHEPERADEHDGEKHCSDEDELPRRGERPAIAETIAAAEQQDDKKHKLKDVTVVNASIKESKKIKTGHEHQYDSMRL